MKKILLLLACFFLYSASIHAQNVIFEEDFEATTPVKASNATTEGWIYTTSASGSPGWMAGNTRDLSSANLTFPEHGRFVAVNDEMCSPCVKNPEILITPEFELSGDKAFLQFEAFFNGLQYSNFTETLKIRVSTDQGKTWKDLGNVPGNPDWTTHFFDLSAYIGKMVRVAFSYSDARGNFLATGIDDIKVINPIENSFVLSKLVYPPVISLGSTFNTGATLTNKGSNPISSVVLAWNFGDEVWVQDEYKMNLSPTKSIAINHLIPVIAHKIGVHNLSVKILKVNGVEITDSNEPLTGIVDVGNMNGANRNPVLFEFTGSWCGYCPRGAYYLNYIQRKYPQAIGVAVHGSDPMSNADGNNIIRTASISGYPSAILDHTVLPSGKGLEIEKVSWWDAIADRLTSKSPVEVKIVKKSYNEDTRELEATVRASFASDVSGNINLGCYLLEDSIMKDQDDYHQKNYYNNTQRDGSFKNEFNTDGTNPFYQKGESMHPYYHNHVFRSAFGSPYGVANIINQDPKAGETYEYTFKQTLSPDWNPKQVALVGIAQRNESDAKKREILNACEEHLTENKLTPNANANLKCGESAQLGFSSSDPLPADTKYSWKPETGLSDPNIANPVASPKATTTYTLTVTLADGTTNTMQQTVYVAPKLGFTPSHKKAIATQTEVWFSNRTLDPMDYTFLWNFGDGETSTLENPKHIYQKEGSYDVSLTATAIKGGCVDVLTATQIITVVDATSIQKTAVELHATISPNPNAGNFQIKLEHKENADLSLYNIAGVTIWKGNITQGNGNINLEGIAKGIYLLKINQNNKTGFQKIIIE